MKLNIKWFSISLMTIGTFLMTILFVWTAANGFGSDVVKLFESIHPSGGFAIIENLDKSFANRIPGILINMVYTALDFFIIGFLFSSLYNFLLTRFGSEKTR